MDITHVCNSCLCNSFSQTSPVRKSAQSGSNARRRAKRARTRHWERQYHTDLKHQDQVPVHQKPRHTRSLVASNGIALKPIHRVQFQGKNLLFIGYGLQVHKQGDLGWGLRTTVDINANDPITQYEVCNDHFTVIVFSSYAL
jgi:hypothetical protein